ncbi:MAG: 3-deoxy-manno-octulosonate cytidylyltransferase [candidate division Zixibacteria bacterium]|nr:3-deoxy-manno-octulosonate cytidylyltransferase [candidate division Zixibacteria bacterium]
MAGKVIAVIPARLGSSRFPGKVLYPLNGKPLLYHVWRRVSRAKLLDRVLIATDNADIQDAAAAFGAEVVRTSSRHRTGSDRVAEVAAKNPGAIYINIQGDNFGLKPQVLDRVVALMQADSRMSCATLARSLTSSADLFDPNTVKVIVARDGRALWFSRWPLPYLRGSKEGASVAGFSYLSHIGVYFFRRGLLQAFGGWKRSPQEKAESLEQLRILENGYNIQVVRTSMKTVSVDTPADIDKIARLA